MAYLSSIIGISSKFQFFRDISYFTRLLNVRKDEQNDIVFPNFVPRKKFELPINFERKDWYPKHMGVQMKVMEGKLRSVDLILEVHDARVAITGRNPNFGSKLYAVRPHILILNKMDLIDMERYKEPIENYYKCKGIENIFWTNCMKRTHKQWDCLRNMMIELLQMENRFNRTIKSEYQVMVVGIPNVGKSSLINSLRKNNLGFEKAVVEGPYPGVTTRVHNRIRIWDRPPIYILDTPGILNPWIHNVDEAMKLALCNLILESTTKPYYVADYLLYFMNKYKDFSYLELLKVDAPNDDIKQVLIELCRNNNLKTIAYNTFMDKNNEVWDIFKSTDLFLKLFRTGHMADNFLDRDLLGFIDSSVRSRLSNTNKRQRRKIF